MAGDASQRLMQKIRREIESDGPISFARYMDLALYDPDHGYYADRVPGKGGHYLTSASVGPWFGRMVAIELRRMWEALQCPEEFTVIEVGAGYASLAREAIRHSGELRPSLRWRFVERFERVRELQRDNLGPDADCAEWITTLEGAGPIVGCELSNELLDNFPVHVFERTTDGVAEVLVDAAADGLRYAHGPPSPALVDDQVLEAAEHLQPGDRFEICPGIGPWFLQAGKVLERGYILLIDYGDEQPDIWRKGRSGTIRTYGPRSMNPDPLQDPGCKDITADVDFTAVWSAASAAGFKMELLALQRFWMVTLGLPAVLEDLSVRIEEASMHGKHVEAADLDEEQRQAMALADPRGLGGCLVFRASKGFD